LIAGAALMLAYILRSRAAADRALVLRIGVTMLLLLPVIAIALPILPIEAWAAPQSPAAPLYYLPGPEAQLPYASAAGLQPAPPTIWDDPTPLVLLAYLGGLLMVGGRLLAGLVMLRRWTRDAREVTCPEWLAAFARARAEAGYEGEVRLLASDAVPSPLSWGFARPAILIDPDTLDEPREAEAILAHEMAHVARRDWLALMLTRIAAALFWFNPLVWLLEREIVQQAEEAADCEAARCVEPARYAQTLLSWAQVGGRALPANSIAPKGSALGRRVRAILDRRMRERPAGSALTGLAVLACIAIAAPVAAMKLVQASAPPAPEAPPAPVAAPEAPPAPPAPGAPDAPHAARAPLVVVPDIPEIPDIAPIVNEVLADVLPQIPDIVASATAAIAAIDPEEIERATDEALREARPHISRAERERIRREVRRALEQGRVQRVEAVRLSQEQRERIRTAMRSAQRAQRAVRAAPRAYAHSMAHGADGMAQGAAGMERGALQMEQQAQRLRDPAFREQAIARARARGETVTHEDLIEAAQGLQEGAQGMREGAREMREAAERMRSGRN
jgi:beta-lactamase regulating signal transducer with metallopeptidase domain